MVERMAGQMISVRDIAAILNCSEDTLRRAHMRDQEEPLQVLMDRARAAGRASLSQAQFKRALAGSDRMLTWLGIQHLGQSPRAEDRKPDTHTPFKSGLDVRLLSLETRKEILAVAHATQEAMKSEK